jgi:hypothetical protein
MDRFQEVCLPFSFNMEPGLIILWFLSVLIFPPAILWLGYTGYSRYREIRKLLIRLTIAILGYAITTFFSFLFLAGLFALGGAHVKRTGNELAYALIIVIVYLLCGWVSCSIAHGRMVRSFADLKPVKEGF